ncbi:MAG TPA: hypothetical protein VJ841_05370, partial [Candidatus Saccharimonadales bacterium]|nr:hypothetical protein [Candidatus Saccharimonadales bacterium]
LYDCSEATNDLPRLVGTNRDVVIKYTIKDGSGKVLQAFNSQSLFAIPDYSFTDYGDYTVEVTFSFKDNNETLPNSIKVDDYTYKFGKMTFVVTVNGSSYYGDTSGDPDAEYPSECTTTGADTVCGPPDLTKNLYEDCSIYGTDIIGGFGCIMRNFGIWLREELLIPLFVPKASFLQNYFSEFRAFITGKLGFLIWPVEWSVNFVRAFFDGLNGTNNICGWSFGNIMGGDFKLNFCSLEQNFPAAFNTARYMIQAFTVFALISGLYGHYRRLIHT